VNSECGMRKAEWKAVTLGDIMATKSGSVDPSKFTEEVFDLYSIPAFDRGEPEIVAGSEIGSAKQVVEPGDVLLSKIVPHIRRSWVVGKERGRRIIASGEWIVFRNERASPDYLRQVLVGDPFHTQFMNTVAGVGGSLLRARPAHVARIVIPLPPLAEQRRIAEVLDRAEALRAKRRAALAQLDSLTQSLFLDLFGEAHKESKHPQLVLDECAEVVSGIAKGRKLDGKKKVEAPYLRVANVQAGFLNLSEIKTIEALPSEVAELSLKPGDVVLTEGGDHDKLGRGAMWSGEIEGCIHQNHVFRVRPNQSQLLPRFFHEFLQTPAPRAYFLRCAKRTTNLASINMTQLRALPVLLPPISLQREFARRVTAVEALKTAHRASLAELDALFATLQHRAFRGEL